MEQDGNEILDAVIDAIAELLDDTPDVTAFGLDHQGESVLAWDAETGEPLSPVVVWQDKRTQQILDRLAPDADEIAKRSSLPLDPYFSSSKLTWLLEYVAEVRKAADAGTLRLGNVDAWLTDKLGGLFATDASTASRTQLHRLGDAGWDAGCASASACRHKRCPKSATASASSASCGTIAGPRTCR